MFRLRAISAWLVVALLAPVIVVVGTAAGLSTTSGVAVRWNPLSADAHVAAAKAAFANNDYVRATKEARAALALAPLEPEALRVLGLASGVTGAGRTEEYFLASSKLTRRDGPTQAWLFDRCLATRQFACAADHADLMMRRNVEVRPQIYAALLSYLRYPEMTRQIADRLAAAPTWRLEFLRRASSNASTIDAVSHFAQVLKSSRHPMTWEETSFLMKAFVAAGRYDDARGFLATTPFATNKAHVQQGGFDGPNPPEPFNWALLAPSHAEFAPSPFPGSGKALHVQYGDYDEIEILRQTMLLTPGAYALAGDFMVQSDAVRVQLAVSCADTPGQPMAIISPTASGTAQAGRLTATIEVSCPVQIISVRVPRSDRRLQTDFWVDNIRITPQSGLPS